MRTAFWGTPSIAATVLEALIGSERHTVECVVTMPDRPAGRRRRPSPSPVKMRAEQSNIPVLQPDRAVDVVGRGELAGCDVYVVAAYGGLLPPQLLDATRHGCVNVHPSLLPRWRGAAPVEHALLEGDETTGVCIMQMDEGLDTGPVLARVEVAVPPSSTAGELLDDLGRIGAALLVSTLDGLEDGHVVAEPQSESGVTYAPKLASSNCRIHWSDPVARVDALVRAANPRPGAWTERVDTYRRGTRCKIWRGAPALEVHAPEGLAQGAFVALHSRLFAVCADGLYEVHELQQDGSRRMDAASFLAGCRDALPECV